MLQRQFIKNYLYCFTLLLLFMLSGCPGGGGSSGENTSNNEGVTTETATDTTIATINLVVTDNHQPADGNSMITLTVIVKNKGNLPLVGIPVSLVTNSDFVFLAAVSGMTEESGRFTTTAVSSIPGTFQVTPIAAGVKGPEQEIIFVDSQIDQRVATVKLIVTDNGQRANGLDPVTVTVTVRDSNGAPVQNAKIQLVSSSDSAKFTNLSGVTGEDGRFTTTIVNDIPETFKITASAGGKQSESVEINFITSIDADYLQLEPSETILLQQNPAEMTVTAMDYVTRTTEGEILYYKPFVTSFNVAVSGSAELHNLPPLPVLPTTDANGKATFTVTDSVKEDVTVTVSSGRVTQTTTLHFGASLSLLPNISNSVGTAKLKALLKGGNNNPLPGERVAFRFIGENNKTLSPVETMTTSDGTAEVTVTDLISEGGNVTVEAQSDQVTARATINFIANLTEDRTFEVKPSAVILAVDQTSTITALIKDNIGIPVSNQSIIFKVDGQAELSSSEGMTDAEGKISTVVSNKTAENVTVTIRAGAKEQTVLLYFGATLRLTLPKITAIANGKDSIEIVAHLSDASGGSISGIPIDFRVTKSKTALLSTFREITDELGRATASITNTVPEETIVKIQVDNLTAEANFNFISADIPDVVTLETSPDDPIELSLNGTAVIKAIVKDNQGKPVRDGTQVNFSTSNLGSITESLFTRNGEATAIFNAGTKSGLTAVTASVPYSYFYFDDDTLVKFSDSIEAGTSITIKPGEAGIIEVYNIDPKVIGIKGSGVAQAANIQFLVKDPLGNPVKDGTPVTFSLGNTTLGGGETITTGGDTVDQSVTNNGLVSVTLKSGVVAGNVDVIATVGEVSTVARVAIVGSVPDANHLALAVQYFNIAGGVTFGLFDNITAYVGDRFGNIVPDGTSVSFITEGGTIGKSIGGGAFTTTTEFGQAVAVLQSAEPTTPSLGGVPLAQKNSISYRCCNHFDNSGAGFCGPINDQISSVICGNPGLVTIVAYTTGSESFTDSNGNGRYDKGESFIDTTEPFIDGNDNDQFDEGELYIDVNNNRKFDGKDEVFQDNTTVWRSTKVLFSAPTAPLVVEPTTFEIPNSGSQRFEVRQISDIYGNALVAGSKFEVTTNNGVLGGTTDFTLLDSNGLGMTGVEFTLASNPPEKVSVGTGDAAREELRYPPTTAATITVKIISPFKQESPGGNGDIELVIAGRINVAE